MGKVQRPALVRSDSMRQWTVRDSLELFNIPNWGGEYFGINESGHIVVHPSGEAGPSLDLKLLVDDLQRRGIKGKLSVLPYPAGLGSIARGLPGCSRADLDRWLAIVRRQIAPRMDITPEILTHSKTIDLATHTLLAENEREWSTHQTAETLTPYIAEGLRVLNEVGLPATGVTSPWDFGSKVEPEYQRAIFSAQQEVNARRHTWYFLHQSSELSFSQRVVYREAGGWLVSMYRNAPMSSGRPWRTKDVSEPTSAPSRTSS